MTLYEDQQCCRCGVWFGVPTGYTENRRKDKERFFCPNGHGQSYTESEADKLRRERDRLKQQEAMLMDENARLLREREKAEAETRRLKRRVSAGSCPCCQRSFSNMSRHMKTKHPEFIAENVVKLPKRA